MTLQVLVQVTQFWKMFTPLCLDFSSFFFSRSFHLAITMIKSSGSYIEFESLYFSPIIVFHSSCHSNRNHFSLLARQIFSFAVLVFSIFTIKYAGLVRFGNQRRWTMSKRIFNYTVPSEGKKEVCWNYALLYGSWASQPKATHSVFVLRPSFLLLLLTKVVFRTAPL